MSFYFLITVPPMTHWEHYFIHYFTKSLSSTYS